MRTMRLLELLRLDKGKKEKDDAFRGGARQTKGHTFGNEEAVVNAVLGGRVRETFENKTFIVGLLVRANEDE